jgi:hypothetical protein
VLPNPEKFKALFQWQKLQFDCRTSVSWQAEKASLETATPTQNLYPLLNPGLNK